MHHASESLLHFVLAHFGMLEFLVICGAVERPMILEWDILATYLFNLDLVFFSTEGSCISTQWTLVCEACGHAWQKESLSLNDGNILIHGHSLHRSRSASYTTLAPA